MRMRWFPLALLLLGVILSSGPVDGAETPSSSQAVQEEEDRDPGPTSWDTQAANAVSTPVLVPVGPGFSDVSVHQVVRTAEGRVYVFAPELYAGVVHAYRAIGPGVPSGFQEVDIQGRPSGKGDITTVDAAIDGSGLVHLAWLDEAGPVVYQSFDTRTDSWNPPITLVEGGVWPNPGHGTRQGSEGVALALDPSGTPHVVYTMVEDSVRRLWYRSGAGGQWSSGLRVDDAPGYNNGHPALAFDASGRLHLAWLVEQTGINTGDIRMRSRAPGGEWDSQSLVIASGPDVYSDDRFAIDQGPSLIVTPDGSRHVAYIAAWERSFSCSSDNYQYGGMRYGFGGSGDWESMRPEPSRFTHNPSLAVGPAGELYLFGHDDPCLHPDAAAIYLLRRAPSGPWRERELVADGPFDSSVSVKWSWNFRNQPDLVEAVFWTQTAPNQLYYLAIPPR